MARAYGELCGIVGQEGTRRLTADPRPILILRYKHVFVDGRGWMTRLLVHTCTVASVEAKTHPHMYLASPRPPNLP